MNIRSLTGGAMAAALLLCGSSLTSTAQVIKHLSTTNSCSTAMSFQATCAITFTWPGSAFVDTRYTVTCNAKAYRGVGSFSILIVDPNKTVTTFTALIENATSYSVEVDGLDCIAVHD